MLTSVQGRKKLNKRVNLSSCWRLGGDLVSKSMKLEGEQTKTTWLIVVNAFGCVARAKFQNGCSNISPLFLIKAKAGLPTEKVSTCLTEAT